MIVDDWRTGWFAKVIQMRRCVAGVVGALAGVASALGAGTITSGNATLNFPLVPIFSSTLGDANLLCDPSTPDTLYKLTWFYRSISGTNRIFSALDTPSESYAGNTATIVYSNAGDGPVGQARWDARLSIAIADGAAAGQAIIEQRLAFSASAANTSTQTWQVFLLIDPDIGGSATDDVASVADASAVRVRMTESASATAVDCYGLGASRYELSGGSALRGKLGSGSAALTTASGTSVPATAAGDNAFAFQWTVTLAPGQTRVISSKYGYGQSTCRADFNNDGVVSVQDIFDFLASWFAQGTFADFNLDGSVGVQDIFDFLGVWFAGC